MAVFHLKYRPTLISELDSIQAAEKLQKILLGKDIPQSFLFAGPKGSGKTSAARILARVVNCENKTNGEPCGECDNCKEIEKGSSIDIIEIDAASNRGIDDVRSLKEKAYLSPSKLKNKVFIIDEVHMLTKDAFNALLKLIEEPPKHTIFVLCTTDPDKIPDTVLSRLTKIDFKKGNKDELKKSLSKIISGENLKVEDQIIDFLINKNDGSFRNLHRDFNELILNIGETLTLEAVADFYSLRGGDYSETDFEYDLDSGKTKTILERLEKMAEVGSDFSGFRVRLINFFQKRILANFGVVEEKSVFSLEELEFLMDLLIRAAKQEKDVEIDQLPLQLVAIDFIKEKRNKEEKNEGKKKQNKEEGKKSDNNQLKKKIDVNEGIITVEENVNIEVGLDKIEESWGNVLLSVKPFNHSVEAFLRAARPVRFDGRSLVLEVFYPFHKDRLEEVKNRKLVEECFKKIIGSEVVLEYILGKTKKEPLVIENTTPVENINENLVEDNNKPKDLYDVAKDIFG